MTGKCWRPLEERGSRLGVTILEVFVAVGVMGLLAALLLPAVQRSRESARAAQCKSQLRQVGLGLHQHHDAHGYLPREQGALSHLLPYVGYAALYEKIKPLQTGPPFQGSKRVAIYECPSDPDTVIYPDVLGLTSYYPCLGIKNPDTQFGWDGLFGPGNDGRRNQFEGPTWRVVTDGLSQTAAFAEAIQMARPPHAFLGVDAALSLAARAPERFTWYTARKFSTADGLAFAEHCLDPTNRTAVRPPLRQLLSGGYGSRGYDHLLPPNQIACWNGPVLQAGENYPWPLELSAAPASSLHHGGAHTLMCDGSVHLISETIDSDVWRALGSVSGGEQMGDW